MGEGIQVIIPYPGCNTSEQSLQTCVIYSGLYLDLVEILYVQYVCD